MNRWIKYKVPDGDPKVNSRSWVPRRLPCFGGLVGSLPAHTSTAGSLVLCAIYTVSISNTGPSALGWCWPPWYSRMAGFPGYTSVFTGSLSFIWTTSSLGSPPFPQHWWVWMWTRPFPAFRPMALWSTRRRAILFQHSGSSTWKWQSHFPGHGLSFPGSQYRKMYRDLKSPSQLWQISWVCKSPAADSIASPGAYAMPSAFCSPSQPQDLQLWVLPGRLQKGSSLRELLRSSWLMPDSWDEPSLLIRWLREHGRQLWCNGALIA